MALGYTCGIFRKLTGKLRNVKSKDGNSIIGDGLTDESIRSLIRQYNVYRSVKENKEAPLDDDTAYTDEQLRKFAEDIRDIREGKIDISKHRQSVREAMFKTMSSPEALSNEAIRGRISGKELHDIKSDAIVSFVGVVGYQARQAGKSFDEYVDSLTSRDLMRIMEMTKTNLLKMALRNRDSFNPESEEYAEATRLITNVFGVANAGKYNDSIVENIMTLVIPTINKLFNIRINSDFTVSPKTDTISEDDDYRLEDMEEVSSENWQQDPDELNPVNGMASCINRLLIFTVPEMSNTITKKYYIQYGNERTLVGENGTEAELNEILEDMNDIEREEYYKNIVVEYDSVSEDKRSSLTGITTLSNPSRVARRLYDILDGCTTGEEMIGRLKKDKMYSRLVTKLESNPFARNTFVSNFNRYTQEAICTTVTVDENGNVEYKTPKLNENKKSDIVNDYVKSRKYGMGITSDSIFDIKANFNGKENVLSIKNIAVLIMFNDYYGVRYGDRGEFTTKGIREDLIQYLNNDTMPYDGSDIDIDKIISEITMLYSKLCMNVSREAVSSIVNNRGSLALFIKSMDSITSNLMNSKNRSAGIDVFNSDLFRSSMGDLLKLASVEDYGSKLTGMFTYAGKKQSARILPSTLTTFFKKIRSLSSEELIDYLEHQYFNSPMFGQNVNGEFVIYNRVLSDIYNLAKKMRSSDSLLAKIGVSRNMGIGGNLAENATAKEQYLMNLTTYLNNRLFNPPAEYEPIEGTPMATDKYHRDNPYPRNDFAYIPSFVTGDNNTARYFVLPHYTENEIYEGIYNLYLADVIIGECLRDEYKNGSYYKANDKEAFATAKNVGKFGILQFLNNVPEDVIKKASPDGKSMDKDSFINDVLKPYLKKSFNEYKLNLQNEGILDEKNGKYIHLGKFAKNSDELDAVLKDYFLNYKFGMYNMLNIAHVTPLFFNGVEDLQKRNKATLTNGYQVMIDAVNPDGSRIFEDKTTFRGVYFSDVSLRVDNETGKVMRDIAFNHYRKTMSEAEANKEADKFMSKFDKNSSTDGQAIRSFDSYRDVLASIGEPMWNTHKEKAYRRIKDLIADKSNFDSDGNLEFDVMNEINDLMLVMQPIKPINDGIETVRRGSINEKVSFQLKYAEVPILPEMYPVGSKLRQMGEWMRDNKIDFMASTKCLKDGCFGEFDIQYVTKDGAYIDGNGNIIPGLDKNGRKIKSQLPTIGEQRRWIKKYGDIRVEYSDDVSFDTIMANQSSWIGKRNLKRHGGYIHNIPIETMLIQNNVPDHTDSRSILGTQGRKIIDHAIITTGDYVYNVGGRIIKGSKLKEFYNLLHSAKYAKSFETFMRMINNPTELQRNLVFSLLNNDRTNPSFIDRIALDKNGNPVIPYSELSSNGDIMSALMSMFRKSVIRQTISGGSIVQATSLGVGGSWVADQGLRAILDGKNIKGVEAEIPFEFSVNDERGGKTKLRYDDYCNADGTFKMTEDGKQTLIERDYPGILDMVCYRIPTEKEYSMFAIHVKRVTPKGCANSIKLPVECSTIAGFDFDIDKLFLMRHNYTIKSELIDNNEIWEDIYSSIRTDRDGNPLLDENENRIRDEHSSYIYRALDAARSELVNSPNRQNELNELARKFDTTPDKLKLHQFWEKSALAGEDKLAIFDEAMKEKHKKWDYVSGPEDVYKRQPELENMSMSDIDNLLVDIYLSVLSDPSTAMSRIEVGGFSGASESARRLRLITNFTEANKKYIGTFDKFVKDGIVDFERLRSYIDENDNLDFKPEYDYSDPSTAVIFKELNQAGGSLIGIFANDNVNAFISSKMKTLAFNEGSRILFGSLYEGKARELDGKVGDIYDSGLGCNLLYNTVNNVEVLKSLAQMLAASVDAVKDPVLNYLNINTITADAAGMLLRLGYTTDDVGLLLNQPVIKAACRYMRYNGVTNVSEALKAVLPKFGVKDVDGIFNKGYNPSELTQDKLASVFINKMTPSASGNIQRNVAILFNQIMVNARELSNYIQSTRNTSANVVKSRFADELSSEQKSGREYKHLIVEANDNLDNPITSDWSDEDTVWDPNGDAKSIHESLYKFIYKYKSHPYEYENMVYNITRYAINYMMNKFTPYKSDAYTAYLDMARKLISPWGMSGDNIDLLLKQIPMIVATRSNGAFNPEVKTKVTEFLGNTIEIPNKSLYTDRFMARLSQQLTGDSDFYAKTDEEKAEFEEIFETNEFLNKLKIKPISPDVMDSSETFRLDYSYSISPEEKTGMSNALKDIYDRFPEFAKDLVMSFFYTYGMNPSYNPIMDFIPTEIMNGLMISDNVSYVDMFKKDSDMNVNTPQKDMLASDLAKFMLMNAYNTNIVPKMTFSLDENTVSIVNESTVVTLTGENKSMVEMGGDKEHTRVRPFININGKIYGLIDSIAYTSGEIVMFGQDGMASNLINKKSPTVQYAIVKDSGNVAYSNRFNGYMYGVYSIDKSDPLGQTAPDFSNIIADSKETNPSEQAARKAASETKNDKIVNPDGKTMC